MALCGICQLIGYLSAGSSKIRCNPDDRLPLMLCAELWSWKRRSCCWTGVGAARQREMSPRILGSGPSFATVACRKEFSPWGRRVCVCVWMV